MLASSILNYPARIIDSEVLCKHDFHMLIAMTRKEGNPVHVKKIKLISASSCMPFSTHKMQVHTSDRYRKYFLIVEHTRARV